MRLAQKRRLQVRKRGDLVYEGSAKDKLHCDDFSILFKFKDSFSVFDRGRCPQLIPGKGVAVCSAAVQSFKIARAIGIPTGFIERVSDDTIRVQRVDVIDNRALTIEDTNCLVPAEWIARYRVAGSLLRAFRSGKKLPTDFGFLSNEVPVEGTPLPWPVEQFTTKWEDIDREITTEEAIALCGLTPDDVDQFWALMLRLDGAISLAFAQAGFGYWDGKMEMALFGPYRQKGVADVFATQDESRPVLLADFADGKVTHYGKEFMRQHLIEIGYYEELCKAREAGQPEPPYPTISDEIISEAARRYAYFAAKYCAVKTVQ